MVVVIVMAGGLDGQGLAHVPVSRTAAAGSVRGDWLASTSMVRLRPMQQPLRVDSAGVQVMAGRWGATARDLEQTTAPAGMGLSSQASAAAVNAAHADVAAFTAGLAAQITVLAVHVAEADSRYIANEVDSANELAAVAYPEACV